MMLEAGHSEMCLVACAGCYNWGKMGWWCEVWRLSSATRHAQSSIDVLDAGCYAAGLAPAKLGGRLREKKSGELGWVT